jgi:DNA-directed RNA polymerase subunit RPC12/RpoP
MSTQSYNCPGCGAPLAIEHRFSKTVVCQYCNQTSFITPKGLDPTGSVATLADFPSIFAIGKQGSIKGRPFRVSGRIRYSYEDGHWDEWFLALDGGKKFVWLEEDEGQFTLYEKQAITTPIPTYEEIFVGKSFLVNNLSVFVTEKNKASLAGGQGELNFRFCPGDSLQYVDGNAAGKLVSIEITPEELNLSMGESVEEEEIEFLR